MKKLLVLLSLVLAALALPGQARAIGQCGLPSTKPLWIDFTPLEYGVLFGKPGMILGVSTGEFPARMRAAGAKTVYWDMNLRNRVGVPNAPAPSNVIVERANRLFDFAAQQSGCDKPLIALNELNGAHLETPWSAANAQYRANVLTLVRTLAERGARPFLLVASPPYTGGEAGDWWREVAKYSDLIQEIYPSARALHRLGPIGGNRALRLAMRRGISAYTELGIPVSRLGVILGFQTAPGTGGRERLQPATAWFEVVKWQVLSAKQVASETGIATIWSWGWGTYSEAGRDPDKPTAACVYLWTRNPSLCNAPDAAGPGFDTSLTEGQIRLRAGVQCSFGQRTISSGALAALQRITGDREVAFSALLARHAEAPYATVPTTRVLAAERAVIAVRFNGSRGAYLAALRAANASLALARGILADELRRVRIEETLRARRPSAREVSAFYTGYPDLVVRQVEARPAPWWLGGRARGLALDALAPPQIFALATGRRATVRGLEGIYTVRTLGDPQPLGSVPFAEARPAIAAALAAFARRAAFESWSVDRQEGSLARAICRRDDLPAPGTIRLTSYLPFLSLAP